MIKKILPYVSLLVGWLFVSWMFISDYSREAQIHDNEHIENISSTYRFAIKRYDDTARLFLKNIIDTEQNKKLLKAAFLDKSRESSLRQKLYNEMIYKFASFKNIGFNNVTFTDAKGNVFLRIQNSDRYGDNLAAHRRLLAKTLASKKQHSGFEIGRLYDGISFCYPLELDGELIGAFTATVSSSSMISTLESELGGKFDFLVDRSSIEKNIPQDFQKNYKQSYLSPIFLRSSSAEHEEMFSYADRLAGDKALLDVTSLKPQVAHVGYKNAEVGIALLPIKNSDGELAAYFVQYTSSGHMKEVFQRLIAKLFVITLLFVLILLALIKQKKLFVKIEESERYFKTLFEQATIGVCHVSTEGRFLKVNQKMCDILGYTEEELLYTDFQSITYSDDLLASTENMGALIEGKIDGYTVEKRYIKKNGEPIWVRVKVGYLSDEHGNPKYLIVTVDDMDNEVKDKRLIKLQKEQMDSILGAIPSMVYIKDRKHRIVYANVAACNFLGFENLEQINGKNTYELIFPQDDAKKLFEEEESVFLEGKVLSNFEEKLHSQNGETRIILSTRQPFMLEGGEKGLLGISSDITTVYEARRTSSLLRKFFDNTKEAMIIADEFGNIQRVNSAFVTITGYEQEEVLGKNPRILQSGVHDDEFYKTMWSDVTQKGRWVGEIYDKRKNGEVYPQWLAINAIKDESGKVTNYISTIIDLTKIKEDEATIKRQAELLVSQSRYAAMGEMIGMIAHQWRQPITTIGMAANNMMLDVDIGDIDMDTFRKHLESIDYQVQFLSHTIDDFRNFFKPQAEPTVVKIETIIQNAIKIIGKSLDNNNISVEVDARCGTSCSGESCDINVEVHEGELVQALLVFLGNAKDVLIDNAVQNPEIAVGCSASFEEGFVEVSICDNGGGVPEELTRKIFEPYFTTKSAKNGTGLGLYIAKTIVEKHQGGSIGMRNVKNGACFWIKLPLKRSEG